MTNISLPFLDNEQIQQKDPFTLVPRIVQRQIGLDVNTTLEGNSLKTKYRPQKLEEVVPTCNIELLKNQIDSPKAPQVYLFEGKTGTGKTTCAHILAKASVCLSKNTADKPCLNCDNCNLFKKSYDKIEINASNQNKVEDIRELIEDMRYGPGIFSKKIYILDEVQRLTDSAQQALLTELEEPYSYLLVFLCTTDIEKINTALVHRSYHITFNRMTPEQSNCVMKQVCSKEQITIPDDMAELMYLHSGGSIRELLNLIEQYKDSNGKLQLSDVEDTSIQTSVEKLFKALHSGDWSTLTKLLGSFDIKKEPDKYRYGLQNYIRGVLLKKDLDAAIVLSKALEEISKSLPEENSYSRYNNLVMRCTKICGFFRNLA